LLIGNNELQWTISTLGALLGEVRAIHSITDVARLEVEIPVRLQHAVKSALQLSLLETFALQKDQQYRPLRSSGQVPYGFSDALDDWT
jgi:hypothetical protein